MKTIVTVLMTLCLLKGKAQQANEWGGRVVDEQSKGIVAAMVQLLPFSPILLTDSAGNFVYHDSLVGTYTLVVSAPGYESVQKRIILPMTKPFSLALRPFMADLGEVVVSGSLREVSRDASPVNIEIITPKLFQKTATANLFEATSFVNGVKPQINCNVCNTGDIHINGLEGPYTLILIDGMPIVSGLSSVYGLMGIPASMIERLEIAKGPSASLFGSEAMGGTINLITKNPKLAPAFYLDYYATSYLEHNLDLSTKLKLNKKTDWLIGANAFWYNHKTDVNHDGFTDVTLQQRVSLFNKINIQRKQDKEFSLAARYVYEDRWGGELNWTPAFRGGDSIYGESVYVSRSEIIGKYEWPLREKIITQVSYNLHDQNSVYGTNRFNARQSTAFAQTFLTKHIRNKHQLLLGVSIKNNWYDDNTVATREAVAGGNKPDQSYTSALFVQNETQLDSAGKHTLLLGARLDYNTLYKWVPSPRIAYKWSPHYRITYRFNAGTGFRIVNVFTEDHAALSGSRDVIFVSKIKPETSYNGSFNLVYKQKISAAHMLVYDASLFYYYFTNKIVANYDANPNQIIYDNLNGYSFSRGFSLSMSNASVSKWKGSAGITYADVQNVMRTTSGFEPTQQLHAPRWSGNYTLGYEFGKSATRIDLSGNWYGPQRLPLQNNDFRKEYSPWFCLVNLQASGTVLKKFELYGGIKNLLNFLPQNPIMRSNDPFDKQVQDTNTNPHGYTFDTGYSYAPMQGIRGYLGLRMRM